MSTQPDFFRSQTAAAKAFARESVRLPDGALDADGLRAALVNAETSYRAEGGASDLARDMAEETRVGVIRYTLERDANRRRKGLHVGHRHPDRDRLWKWLLPRSLRHAAWLAWQPGANGVVDPDKLRHYCQAAVAAFRSRPGMASSHDEHEDVVAKQAAHRSRFKRRRRNRPSSMRMPARTRLYRFRLRDEVGSSSNLKPSEWSDYADVPVGRAIHDRFAGKDGNGRPRFVRERSGALSVEQVRHRIAGRRVAEWARYYSRIDAGRPEHPVYNPRPHDLDVRVTAAAVRTALAAHHGHPTRDARVQALKPVARDAATYLMTLVRPRSTVAVRLGDLQSKLWEATGNANTERSHRDRLRKVLAEVAVARCGLNLVIAGADGNVVLLGAAGRRIRPETIAKADSFKPLTLGPGLAAQRVGRVDATVEAQDCGTVMRAAGLSDASCPNDMLRFVDLLGYSPALIANHPDFLGCYSASSWGEVLTTDYAAGTMFDLGTELAAIGDLVDRGDLGGIWRTIVAGPVYQAGMRGTGQRVNPAVVEAIGRALTGCDDPERWEEALSKARLRCSDRGPFSSRNLATTPSLPLTRLKGITPDRLTSGGRASQDPPPAPDGGAGGHDWALPSPPIKVLTVPEMPRMRPHGSPVRVPQGRSWGVLSRAS